MDAYLSTYRKDFLWPHVRTYPINALSDKVLICKSADNGRVPCICEPETGGLTAPKESGRPVAETHEWNRLGATAPLLDPKVCPGKTGPAPESEITRYDQPNTYLKKLQEKYPHLYNVLQSAPPDEMIRRVNQDRLRTTYQVDYGHMDEHRDYKKLLAKAGIDSERMNKTVPYNVRPPDYSDTTTNRPGRSGDLQGGVYDPVEFGGSFKEDTNYRDGFRYNAKLFQDSREAAANYIETLEHDSGRAPRQYEHSQEATKKKYAFKDESGQSGINANGDYREGANINRGEAANINRGEAANINRGEAANINRGEAANINRGEAANINRGEAGNINRGEAANTHGGEASNIHREEPGGRIARTIKSGDGVEAFVRSTEKKEEGKALPAWRSEYEEIIGQTGYDIIRDKMHRHGARSRGRSFIERIIMRCRAS